MIGLLEGERVSADLFKDELGTFKSFQAKLELSPSARPKFNRPKPVPYAVKPRVEQ